MREDPNRETAFRAATLRTSLNLAIMGFKISDLVIGMGFFMMAVGATFVLFLAPAVYYAAEVANRRSGERGGGRWRRLPSDPPVLEARRPRG